MGKHTDTSVGTSTEETMTVGQWVTRYPASARVFESRGIDYCCGGKRSLEETCDRLGLDVAALRTDLSAVVQDTPTEHETDWDQVSVKDLVHHIESAHHEYIRSEKSRLVTLAQKVARVHGTRHPELVDLAAAVDQLFLQLDSHLESTEKSFFPACTAWESAGQGSALNPQLVASMEGVEADNAHVGEILKSIRVLTAGFQCPDDACNSYLALFHGLEQLEADLHQHLHKENNILNARLRTPAVSEKKSGAIADADKAARQTGEVGVCCGTDMG